MAKVAIECKKIMVKEIMARLNNADALIVTNFKGLSSQDLTELRKQLKKVAVEYLVVKDLMAKKALKEGPNNRIIDFLEGEAGIAIHRDDPVLLAKALMQFSKEHESLKICGGITKREVISKQDIAIFASLPSRDILLTKLAIVLNSPIQAVVSSLNGIISKLVYALNGVKEKIDLLIKGG